MEYGIWNFHGGLWTAVNNLAAFNGPQTIATTALQPQIQNQLAINNMATTPGFAITANIINPIITAAAACNLNVNDIMTTQPELQPTYEEDTEDDESDESEDENLKAKSINNNNELVNPEQLIMQSNNSGVYNLVLNQFTSTQLEPSVIETDEEEDEDEDDESADERLEIREDSIDGVESENKPDTHQCPIVGCDFEAQQVNVLDEHLISNHKKDDSTSSEAIPNSQRIRYEREEYRCTMCSYTCTTEKAYLRHLRMHSVGDLKPDGKLSCTVCGKDRVGETALAKHMKKHRDDRYFCCDICIFRTVQLKKLIQHRRMHTGEKPHLCPHCAYRSARRDNLRSHVRRVHKQDNIFCDTFSPRGMLLTPSVTKSEDVKSEEKQDSGVTKVEVGC